MSGTPNYDIDTNYKCLKDACSPRIQWIQRVMLHDSSRWVRWSRAVVLPLMFFAEFCYFAFQEVSLGEYGYLEGFWGIRNFRVTQWIILRFRDMYILWCLVYDGIFRLLVKKQLVLIQTKQYFTYQNSVISLSCNCILKSLHLLRILLGELKYLSYCLNS